MKEEIIIKMSKEVGSFAEDKDKAKEIRLRIVEPALDSGKHVILDFGNVEAATQSFIHALISETIRKHTIDVLDHLSFKDCTSSVKGVIEIVIDYMQTPNKASENGNKS